MSEESLAALRAALERDPELAARFAVAATAEEVARIAEDSGVPLDTTGLSGTDELSDAELSGVTGGYTFPVTDWIYCDNPWTNSWCTLKC